MQCTSNFNSKAATSSRLSCPHPQAQLFTARSLHAYMYLTLATAAWRDQPNCVLSGLVR